jgi:hypothetical protein
MRRATTRKRRTIAKNKSMAPLIEGIIPLHKNGTRNWGLVSDKKLISYAKKFIREMGISGRRKLEKTDSGLYFVLWKRKLLGKLGFEDKRRSWKNMTNEELIQYTKNFMKENGISGKYELQKADNGLYTVLKKRKLQKKVGFVEKNRPWKEMDDEELIEHTIRFKEEIGKKGRSELRKADKALYRVLWERGLLDRVGLSNKNKQFRNWDSLTNEELISYASNFLKIKGIDRRKNLERADKGLYQVLRKRKLLDWAFLDMERLKRQEDRKKRLIGLAQAADAMEQFGDAK